MTQLSRYVTTGTARGPNQIEIYGSALLRKVLIPNDLPSVIAIAERLANFERHQKRTRRDALTAVSGASADDPYPR
jgi:hypothetical protein